MHKIISPFLLFILFMLPGQAEPQKLAGQIKKTAPQRVVQIIDGDTIILQDRSLVRLAGIQAPKIPLGKTQWPLAEKAGDLLSDLVLNRRVSLYFGGQKRDRYGRQLAHIFREDGLWIQGEMLKAGLARVQTFPHNRAFAAEMIALEQTARRKSSGLWVMEYYRPKDHAMAGRHHDSFQIIRGTVRDVTRIRTSYYLNFGDDWQSDFTIIIKPLPARKFINAGISPVQYEGKKIEIRGWLKSLNGPMIEASHPEQITIIQ